MIQRHQPINKKKRENSSFLPVVSFRFFPFQSFEQFIHSFKHTWMCLSIYYLLCYFHCLDLYQFLALGESSLFVQRKKEGRTSLSNGN